MRVATCPFRSRSPIGAPLPQRIRAGCDGIQPPYDAVLRPLPQRIRAGCDQQGREFPSTVTLCHSAFVRVATSAVLVGFRHCNLCHSAFVRVATVETPETPEEVVLCHSAFVRVATSAVQSVSPVTLSLPQRIRAGCDSLACLTVIYRFYFATAHSCGLRLSTLFYITCNMLFATAHSCGLRLRKSNAAHCEFAARR